MILIVDDKQENIFALQTVIRQHGFATDHALSGEEALRKLLQNDYALIILDVQMPGMDGFEVAEAATGLNRTKDIPIIFLSAVNTDKKFITRGFESGAVEYLTKPVDPDILILKVRNFYRLYEKTVALKEAEKALSNTVNELHTTLEALPQLAFTTDANGVIDYVNQHWFQFADSAVEFPPAEPGRVLETEWKQLIAAGDPIETEVAILKKDGNFYHHLLRATPVRNNKTIIRWVGTFTSIHEQKTLNEKLERMVEERTKELLDAIHHLEQSNHDLQQFTSVASHDLKEPLRKVQFFGNLLMEKANLRKEHLSYLEKIIRASTRMSSLIDDVLSFASLAKPDPFEKTDLNLVISGILNDLELSIQEKEAVIQVDKLPTIEVIPALVRQLFQNLISNALKFSKPGVAPYIKITSDISPVPSSSKEETLFCNIYVNDNGVGFEEKYKNKIFALFQRLYGREEYEGTGIGLAIAKKIVEKHSGTIDARSQPGVGSTFIVSLPVKQKDYQQQTTFVNSHHSP